MSKLFVQDIIIVILTLSLGLSIFCIYYTRDTADLKLQLYDQNIYEACETKRVAVLGSGNAIVCATIEDYNRHMNDKKLKKQTI